MLFSKLILSLYIQLICYNSIESLYGRDWSIWTKARRLIDLEISSSRTLGLHPQNEIKSFDVYTFGLAMNINPLYGTMLTSSDLNIIVGKGVLLKPDSLNKIQFEIGLPVRQRNTCGMMIISNKNSNTDFISNITLSWKTNIQDKYDPIARPDNGQLFYDMNYQDGQEKRVIFFDSVPAAYFNFVIYPKSNKPINITIATINKCVLTERHVITDCGEKIDQNKKFDRQAPGVPISIKCPTNCIRTWPCWGFKIYSSDSPICWTAAQNFGQSWGDGFYTLYKIDKVYYFRDQINPFLNHGIYCRSSTTVYPGFTFDKKYYDFAVREAKKLA